MKKDTSTHFKQSTLLPWVEMRVACQSRACYEAHSHDEFSFGIIEQGRSEYKTVIDTTRFKSVTLSQ